MNRPVDPADVRRFPVLYVDDETANLETLEYVLGDAFTIETCDNPAEALKLLATKNYAVLLSDQRMPGMTGVELCEQARRISPDTARVIVTAFADAGAVELAVNVGQVSRFVRKPHRANDIARVMREAIEIHRGRVARREVEAYLLSTAPTLAVRGIEAEVGQRVMRLIEPLRAHVRDLRDQASRGEDLQERIEQVHGTAEALYAYGVRLSMGVADTKANRSRLGTVTDATVRALRNAVERVADVDASFEDDPWVPLEAAALSQVVVHLLAAVVDSIEESAEWAGIRIRLHHEGDVAKLSIRYRGDTPSRQPKREPPSFATVRYLVAEAGGTVDYDSTTEGTMITVKLTTVSDEHLTV